MELASSCMGEVRTKVSEVCTKVVPGGQVARSRHTCLVAVRKAFFSESSTGILAATSFSQPYNRIPGLKDFVKKSALAGFSLKGITLVSGFTSNSIIHTSIYSDAMLA